MCWPWTREIPCLSLPLYKKKRLSCRVLVCFVKHFEILRWKILQKWVCLFFFFNRTNHPKEEQSQFGWPALRGFVFVKPQNQNKYVAGSTVQFYIWQHCRWHTVVLCMLGLSFPEHQQSETVFLCHLFLAWSLPCCGAFLWSVKWEQLGSPAAVTGIPLMVFQRCQAGEVYQSHGEVAVQRCCWRNELMLLSPLPAHRPFHLFRFRAKRWKWSQCRCLQDVAWRQRTI